MRAHPAWSPRRLASLLSLILLGFLGVSSCAPLGHRTSPRTAFGPGAVASERPTLRWNVQDGGTLAAGDAVEVRIAGGVLTGLELVDPASGIRLSTSVNRAGESGRSVALPPGRHLTATAFATAADGSALRVVRTLRSAAPARPLTATITPTDGTEVGVGQPILVTFSSAVSDRGAAQRALEVRTSRPVGAAGWHWFSATEVQYRPRQYWPSGTRVTVTARLTGIRTGTLTWGVRDTAATFSVGRAQVLRIDAAMHQMTVLRDGVPIRTVPVSLGRHQGTLRTRSGIKTIMAVERTVHMDSRTVGIDGSDAYNEDVPYAMRLTWSGEYIHGAPWSEWAQGKQDVSHGCTNVSLANGKWLFENSLIGDPVETTGTGRPMDVGNGWGGGWNMSWADWTAGSAA